LTVTGDYRISNEKQTRKIMTDHSTPSSLDPEVIYVKQERISCNGGGGALGHPLVYYSLKNGEAECGYCDRKFIFDPEKAAS